MVTYELFYSPETARVHTLAKTTELEERISALEKLLGTAHGQNFEDLVGFQLINFHIHVNIYLSSILPLKFLL